MADIDTAVQQKHVNQLHKFNHVDNLALAGRAYLDELDRLQAENRRLTDEIESVLQLMDGLAEQWGDEGVFRRCRDRLRSAVESTGGGDE